MAIKQRSVSANSGGFWKRQAYYQFGRTTFATLAAPWGSRRLREGHFRSIRPCEHFAYSGALFASTSEHLGRGRLESRAHADRATHSGVTSEGWFTNTKLTAPMTAKSVRV